MSLIMLLPFYVVLRSLFCIIHCFTMAHTPSNSSIFIRTDLESNKSKLQITSKQLRTLSSDENFNGSYTEFINSKLMHVQLRTCDSIETRLLKEVSRTQNDYKKLKGGTCRSKYDEKVKSIQVFDEEIQIASPGCVKSNVRIDNASNAYKNVLKKRRTLSSYKYITFKWE